MHPARRSKAAYAPRASQAPLAPAGNVGQRQSVVSNLELNISRGEWSCSPNPLAIAGPCPNFQWPFGIQKCPLSPDKCSRDSLRPGMEGREGGREKLEAILLSSLHLLKLTHLPAQRAGLIKDSKLFGGSQTWFPDLSYWENLLVHLPFPKGSAN